MPAANATRQTCVAWSIRLAFGIFLSVIVCAAEGEPMRIYVGTYTTKLGHVDGAAEGIGIYELDSATGELRLLGKSPDIANSSHLCPSRDNRFVYAISEITDFAGRDDGSVTVFSVDSRTGGLHYMQTVSSHGSGPAYVSLDRSGQFLLLANYVAGNVVVFPIAEDGMLAAPTANVQHAGRGVNPDRQEGPHPHSIVPSPDNRLIFVPDLGIDRIVAYRFEPETGRLTAAPELDVETPAGSGPRHLVFTNDGKRAYCTLELASELAAYEFSSKESDSATLRQVQRASTLPSGFSGENATAEVRVAPDGRHVYVSNRGHDSIAVFASDVASGDLRLIDAAATHGKTPRNFGVSPDGNWLIVGNQDSHNLMVFRRDTMTGRITPSGPPTPCRSPALIRFVVGD